MEIQSQEEQTGANLSWECATLPENKIAEVRHINHREQENERTAAKEQPIESNSREIKLVVAKIIPQAR